MKTVTFKIHKARKVQGETTVTMHQLDPHETGVNEVTSGPPHSGNAKIKLIVTAPDALDYFVEGSLIDVTFGEPKN